SQGIPVLGCPCKVCESTNSKDKRLRTSLLIEQNDFTVVIDSGPDFRQQLLREKVKTLDAIIYTHSHQDHVAGLDDIRAFNFFQQKPMDIYATQEVQQNIRREFYYAFDEKNDYPWIPKVKFHSITISPFQIGDLKIIPVEVMHHKLSVLGYRFGDFTYITDASKIAEKEMEKIKGSKILVLNALRKEKHISHFSLAEAIELSQKIGPEKTYFTHMSHQMGLHDEVSNELPDGIYLGYDGLKIEL
ncbi:MAG: MBL fold metallo-hydrolase, partial [Chitinophagales bacterium]|nr:MBL fold metallo-hydrolase [Chitinophagales bacterium]